MSKLGMCHSCPARLMADKLDLDAEGWAEVGATSTAEKMRARAVEIRAAGCLWWWETKEENTDTGQTRTVERCGSETLPHFLRSYGMDLARSANVIREDHEEITQAMGSLVAVLLRPGELPALHGRPAKMIGNGGAHVDGGD